MRYRPRRLASTLKRALRTFPAALVTGARQSGKTTLLRNELPRHRYVSLERPDARARALSDPEGFLDDAGTRTALARRIGEAAALRPGIRAVPWHLAW